MFEAKTDGERAFSRFAMTADVFGEVIIIRAGGSYDGKQGMSLAIGVSSRSAGAWGLCLHLVTILLGIRGVFHVHDGYESVIYIVSGETEVWYGEGLRHCAVVTAGDFLYVLPGIPHLLVNRSDVTTVVVVARMDSREQESVVIFSLFLYLAGLDAFFVAAG